MLIQLRKEKRLTQAEVAARLGRPQSFVAKYEGGERRLDVVEFIEVIEALEGKPHDLIAELIRSTPRGAL